MINGIEAEIAESQLHSSHYLQSVARLGDTCRVTANRDICSSVGIKLLGAGANIDSNAYQRLLHHKLTPALDECLVSEKTVSAKDILSEAEALLINDRRLQKLQVALQQSGILSKLLSRLPINPAIAFKLSVMRDQRKELFEHSLFVTLVSIYIGLQTRLSERQLVQLATAAMLHDIGILHIDPALLDRGHLMTDIERRHLYAHPLVAYLILKESREYEDAIINAVLQHHERLDGSGYPQGLAGDQIGLFGQIIAVAEIVASRQGGKDAMFNALRLETMLKLNSRRYGQKLVGCLAIFCIDTEEPPPPTEQELQKIRIRTYAISAILSGWESSHADSPAGQVSDFINERVGALKMELLDAGLNLYVFEKNTLGMEDDPQACAEASILLEEAVWQVRSILREIRRRWPQLQSIPSRTETAAVSEWISDTEMFVERL